MKIEKSKQSAMVERFRNGEIPLPKTSNDYFFFAALDCKHQGVIKEDATTMIKIIYDKWAASEYFSKRTWKDVEFKIGVAYQ